MRESTKRILSLFIFIFTLIVVACSIYILRNLKLANEAYVAHLSSETETAATTINNEIVPLNSKPSLDYATLSATSFCESQVMGWNLGNSFTYVSIDDTEQFASEDNWIEAYETAFGNPVVTKELIHYISSCGFGCIRIPFSFTDHYSIDISGNMVLSEEWMKRLAEVVDYCYDYDLTVILVPYNDYELMYSTFSQETVITTSLSEKGPSDYNNAMILNNVYRYWTQLADYFCTYDKHLIFENFHSEYLDIPFQKDYAKIHNQMNQVFVNSVRQSEGYNQDRLLMINPFLSELSVNALGALTLPSDSVKNRLLVDVSCTAQYFDQSIESSFTLIESYANLLKTPFVIGSFGAKQSYTPEGFRDEFSANFVKRANAHKLLCFWWDDGDMNSMALINRTDFAASHAEIINALLQPYAMNISYVKELSFDSASDFSYQGIDTENGKLVDSHRGALTLTCKDRTGFPVEPGHMYMASLILKDSGEGMTIDQISYYDDQFNLQLIESCDSSTAYCFTVPEGISYVRIVTYDPNHLRSWLGYQNMFDNHSYVFDIKEYTY